jgi:hypothetical protein
MQVQFGRLCALADILLSDFSFFFHPFGQAEYDVFSLEGSLIFLRESIFFSLFPEAGKGKFTSLIDLGCPCLLRSTLLSSIVTYGCSRSRQGPRQN